MSGARASWWETSEQESGGLGARVVVLVVSHFQQGPSQGSTCVCLVVGGDIVGVEMNRRQLNRGTHQGPSSSSRLNLGRLSLCQI